MWIINELLYILEKIFLAEVGEPAPIDPTGAIVGSFAEAGIWALIGVGTAQGLISIRNSINSRNRRKKELDILKAELENYHTIIENIIGNIDKNLSGQSNNVLPSFDPTPLHNYLKSESRRTEDTSLSKELYNFLNTIQKYNRFIDRIESLEVASPHYPTVRTIPSQKLLKKTLPKVSDEINRCLESLKSLLKK